MNVVMTGEGSFVEVQGTAEGAAFDRAELDALLAPGREGLCRPDPDAAGGSQPVADARLPRLPQPEKIEEMRRILGEHLPERRGARPRRRRGRTTSRSRTSRRSRATRCSRPGPAWQPPGCRRSPTTAVCASTRSTGCPGVLSARWCGPLPKERRPRTTSCCSRSSRTCPTSVVRRTSPAPSRLVLPDGTVRIVEGRMDGRIIREVRGSGGFGYDVVFVADDRPGVTTAELASADKDDLPPRQGAAGDRAGRGSTCSPDRSAAYRGNRLHAGRGATSICVSD